MVAAAVILDADRPIVGLADSKTLTPARRQALAIRIKAQALAWAVAAASVAEIDQLNILQASLLAMRRALDCLDPAAQHALIDGKHIPLGLACTAEAVVGGDRLIPAISAASILAKTHRDAELVALAQQYPQYGFAQHKGYPTRQHLAALQQFGPTPAHRHSFAPVRRVIFAPIATNP